ncbi:hypothetical protein DID88_006174 [Monilinia fructigena]|uniref:Uncharacterized protein n=1 Tax=Monilinia fructigena TaxID=38457 RepID=A0A395J327_9HELO|nr:hypothetical protein DID88_006174 [Monilinia fructigena]
MASSSTSTSYSTDPALYLYTSLTSGSSHIVTATSRLETILKANRIPFKSDLVEIEDWNEYGELKQHIKIVPVSGPGANPAIIAKAPISTQENKKPAVAPAAPPASASRFVEAKSSGGAETTITLALRQATQDAAQKAKDLKKKATEALVNTTKSAPKKTPEPVIIPIVATPNERHTFKTITILQNPDNSTWSSEPYSTSSVFYGESTPKLESVQSPTSSAWRPKHIDSSILMHQSSPVSSGSAEEIKQMKDEETIPKGNEDK